MDALNKSKKMINNIYENLSWLPQADMNFSKNVSVAKTGTELKALANFSLDDNQLNKLSKRLCVLQAERYSLAPLTQINIGIISNATTKLITPAITGSALRFGICLTVEQAEFNQVAQEAFSTQSSFGKNSPSLPK